MSAPTVLVRDRVDIHLDPIRRLNRNALVRGQVAYRSTDGGVSYAVVQIQIDDDLVNVVADEDGWFSYTLKIIDGNHTISISFEGGDLLDPAWTQIESFNFIKNPVLITAVLPNEATDTDSTIPLSFNASTSGAPIAIEVDVYFGPQTGNLRKVGTMSSDSRGSGSYSLRAEFFPKPGRYRTELLFVGNEDFDSAIASASTTVNASTALDLSCSKNEYELGEPITATGRLLDGQGGPLPNALIALEINGQHLSDSRTDEEGRFRFLVDTEELGSGSSTLQAVFRSNESWNPPGRSKPFTVTIGDRKAIPIRSTLIAFAITTLALLTFVALRTKPWKKWSKASDSSDNEEKKEAAEVPLQSGLTTSRAKLGGALRRASYHGFSGTVISTTTKERIADAQLSFPSIPIGAEAKAFESDEKGHFDSPALVAGNYQVLIIAKGYVRESFSITIPHRGEFLDATVKLLPVREKIFAMYMDAVEGYLPKASLWGIWTPRQILDYARKHQASQPSTNQAIGDLTDFVEETFFSKRTPGEEELEVAASKINLL